MKSRRTPISYGEASAAQVINKAMEERTTPARIADRIERIPHALSVRHLTEIMKCSDQTIHSMIANHPTGVTGVSHAQNTNLIGTLTREVEPFVDANSAAGLLAVPRRRVLEMARGGQIPAHPIGHGKRKTWRFRLSELSQAIVTQEPETSTRKRGIIDAGGSQAVPNGKGR